MPVVEGEDSESDVEQELEPASREETAGGTMVSGEAPETDDEEDEPSSIEPVQTGISPPKVTRRSSKEAFRDRIKSLTSRGRKRSGDGTKRRVQHDPRYDSLLHRSQREDVLLFRRDLVERISSIYRTLTKHVQSNRSQLHAVHSHVEDGGHNFRLANEDLKELENRLNLFISGNYLPSLQFPKDS